MDISRREPWPTRHPAASYLCSIASCYLREGSSADRDCIFLWDYHSNLLISRGREDEVVQGSDLDGTADPKKLRHSCGWEEGESLDRSPDPSSASDI